MGRSMESPLKCFTPKAEHLPAKVHIVFDNYMDDQIYSVKATKRAERGEGKVGKVNTTSKEQSYCSLELIYVRLYLNLVFRQVPTHGLGEPLAYGFQTLAKGAAL